MPRNQPDRRRRRPNLSGAGLVVVLASLVVATSVVASTALATPAPTAAAAAPVTTVRTILTDHSILPEKLSVPAGRVKFVTRNTGRLLHELLIIETALGAKDLPVNKKTQRAIDNRAEAVRIGAIRKVKAGKTKRGTFDLTAGHYLLICNIPGHYTGGMTVEFVVT